MSRARVLTFMMALNHANGQAGAVHLLMCEVLAALAFHEIGADAN